MCRHLAWPRITAEGTALASEPWDDDPAWTDVPDRPLVEGTPDGVSLTPLCPEVP